MARHDADRHADRRAGEVLAASGHTPSPGDAAMASVAGMADAPAGARAASSGRLGPAPSKRWRLEPRVLLDAAVPVTLGTLDALADGSATVGDGDDAQAAARAAAAVIDALAHSAPVGDGTRNELVVVDTSIDGWRDLLGDSVDSASIDATASGTQHVVNGDRTLTLLLVNANEDGLGAIDRALAASGERFAALHILSHAADGELHLGNSTLDRAALGANAATVAGWAAHLDAGADVLLYGCDVTAGSDGIAFVRSLATLTGADVAASDDPTGSTTRGGDWELETRTGSIETASIVGSHAAERFDGLLAATPTVSVDAPAEEFINETVSFTVTFDNTGADTGYAPYFDLVVPKGITGVSAGNAFATGDVPLTLVGTWDSTANGGAGGWRDASNALITTHPYGSTLALPTGSVTGDTWSIADLPFGSYTQAQPAVVTAFSGTLNKAAGALVGQALTISARGGFRFGLDPLDNPTTDAPVQQSARATDSVTPDVIRFTKDNDAHEDEVASGPNTPVTYTLRVDVATGETLDLTRLADQLPSNLQYIPGSLSFVTAPSNGTSNITLVEDTNGILTAGEFRAPVGGAPQTGASALLSLNYGTVVGRAGDDIVVTYQAFVPEFDASGANVIAPVAGTDATITNTATTTATYDPDGAGGLPAGTLTETQTNVLTAKPIAIQKGVTVLGGTALPGSTLEYTLAVQVSDFFSLDNLVIDDHFSDGQVFDASFTPTHSLQRDGVTIANGFAGANFTATRNTGTDGSTDVQFRLSDQFVTNALSPRLAGDLFAADATQAGATTVLVTFRTTIEQNFFNVPVGVGDTSVDLGDVLTNNVTQSGRIIQDTLTPGAVVDDTSSTSVTIEAIDAAKSIYAIDGNTSYTNVRVGPGDTVTYRIRIELPTADVESLVIGDFLPLPVFDVGELDPDMDGMANIGSLGMGGLPAAGTLAFGPDQDLPPLFDSNGDPLTLSTLVQVDRANNRFSIDFGSFDDGGLAGGGGPYVIDLLYTFTATDRAFADGLLLTNNATVSLNNTETALPDISRIAQIQVSVATLTLTKGAVSTDANTGNSNESSLSKAGVTFADPGAGGAAAFTGTITSASLAANPITSNETGVDAGDRVTFAIVIENTGSNDAFDLVIRDTLPTDGAGNAIAFTGDLFTTGITLTDPDDTLTNDLGVIASSTAGASTGANIIVITYDLEVSDAPLAGTRVIPNATFANTAELVSYAGRNNGNDFTDGAEGPWTDDASARIHVPTIAKTLVGSAIDNARNTASEAVIGELITYRVTLTLPEGTHPGLQVVDTLDAGLEFVDVTSVTASTGLGSTTTLDTATVRAAAVVSGAVETGRTLVLDLGTVTNAESDNGDAETIVIEYTVRATDIVQNNAGDTLNNSARPREDLDGNAGNGSETLFTPASAANVTIVEPNLDVVKALAGGTRDGGSTVTYTVTISNIAGATGTDAYGVTFADVLPAGLNGGAGVVSVSAVHNNGGSAPVVSYDEGTRTVSAAAFDLQEGESVTLTISTIIEPGVASRSSIANTGTIGWSSLPGADPFERSHTDSSTATFTVAAPTIAKTRIDTSVDNASNSEAQAVVGEEITYRVVITVPEVGLPVFTVRDLIDNGLDFLAIDSITTSAGITSSTIADLNDVTLVRAASSVTTLGTGQERLTIALGNVVNGNSADGVADTIMLVYRVRVSDIVAVTPGTGLNNLAEIRNDRNSDGDAVDAGEFIAQSAAAITRVLQPSLDVQKDVVTTTRDAGSTITYNITITNQNVTNGTKAYDVTLTDVLPAGLLGTLADVDVSAQVVGGGALTATYTEGTRTISLAPFDLELGQSATVTITTAIADNLDIAAVIDNTANIGWSTLPGSAPGVERTFTDSDGASFTLATPTIAKSLVGSSQDSANNASNEVVIGELVTYELRVTLPENTVPRLTLRDVLDPGLEFVAITSVTTPTGVTGATTTLDLAGVGATASTTGTSASGQTLTISLGDVRNVANSDGTAEELVIRYTARVADIPANGAGDTLNNSVTLLADLNRDGTVADSYGNASAANASVLEPVLTVAKDVSTTVRDAGSPVTYTIVLTNQDVATGTDAFDLVFSDTLPASLDRAAARVSVSALASLGAAPTVTYDEGTGLISASGFDLAQGETVTITVNAFIATGLAPSTTVDNTASLTWTTLPGTQAGERTGSASDDASFVTTNPSLTKTLVDTSVDTAANDDTEATVSELLTYEVTIVLPEATSPGVLIADTLDVGLEFVGITSVTASPSLVSNTVTLDVAGVQSAVSTTGTPTSGQALAIALGNITNTDTNDAASETLTIRYQVRVANIAAVNAGAALNNGAALLLDLDGNGSSTDAAGTASAAPVTVLEPRLALDKAVNDTTASPAQRVTYTLTIGHVTPAGATDTDAYDIRVQDSLPAGMTLDVGSISVNGATATANASAGNAIDLTLDTLAPGAAATVTFDAVIVDSTALAGSTLNNTGNITWTTLTGADANERNGTGGGVNDLSASDGASLTVTAVDLAISKTDGDATTTPGGVVPYTISYANNGTEAATGVVLREVVPANAAFNAGASTAGWTALGGGVYELANGTLAAGASGSAVFAVTVDATVPAGFTGLANSVSIRDDGTHGTDLNTADNSGTDGTSVTAAPDYTITKSSTPALPVEPGETLHYTLTIANLGNENGTGVSIVDTFDPTLLQVNAAGIVTPPGVTAVVDNIAGTITFTVTDDALVIAGNSFNITYDTVVASTVAAGVTIIDGPATISGANETNLANNSDDDVLTLTAQPDYRIAKSSSNAVNLLPGERFTYTITVDNVGNQDGTGVVVSDTLPVAVLRTDTLTISDGGSFDPDTGSITWNLGNLAAGATRTLTVDVTLRATLPPATDLQNTASVSDDGANGPDPTPGNNSATDSDLIDAAPDYTVTKTNNAATPPVQPGDVVPFTLTVANLGPEDGTGVVVVDRFDPALLQVNAASIVTPPGVTAVVDNTAGTITFTVTNDALVRSGASFGITYEATMRTTVPAGAISIDGTATVSGANENNLANNTDPDAMPLTAQPDYTIAKSSSNTGDLQPGDTFTYTVTVRNVGNQAGTGVMVSDLLPTNALNTSALVISDGGTFDADNGRITWDLGTLAANTTRTLTVTATVLAAAPTGVDTVVNTASVVDDGTNGADPTPGNNTATDTDPLRAAPDYTITKTSTSTLPVEPGETVPFTLSVANLGNEDGTASSIVDRFDPALLQVNPASIVVPAGVTAVVDNTTGTITFTITDDALVRAGNRFDITYTTTVVAVVPMGAESISGTATISGANEVNLANNTDPDVIPLTAQPGYALTKTSDPRLPVEPGEVVPYTLMLVNVGNQDGTMATIVDRFDASLVTVDPLRVTAPAGVTVAVDATVGTLTLTVTDAALLRVGQPLTVTYEAALRDTLPSGVDELPNSATVTGAGDTNTANDTATNIVSLVARPDYVVTKQSSANGTTMAGGAITYTITVRNDGNQDGTNVVVSDRVPTAVLGTPTAISDGSVFDAGTGTIRWTLPALTAHAERTFTFTATVATDIPAGFEQVTNVVSVTDDGRNGADPNPENNTANVQDALDAAPDYAVTKVRDAIGGAAPGDTVNYTLFVTNHGNQAGSNVILTDLYDPAVLDIQLAGLTLPAGVTATIDATTGTLSFQIADDLVEAGESLTILVSGTVRGPVPVGAEEVTNIAAIKGDGDTNLADNQAHVTDPLLAAPDYTVQKSNNATFPISPGSRIDFTLDVSNIGNQDGSNAVIVDTFDPTVLSVNVAGIVLPPGVTVSVDPVAGTITFRIVDDALVASSANFRIVIPTTVLGSVPLAAEDIDSVVRIAGDNDSNLANNVDTDSIPLTAAPDLAIAKSALETSVAAGGTVTYTLTVSNVGNQDASGVTFTDTYDPATLSIASITPIAGTPSTGVTIVDDGAGRVRFVVTDAALTQAGDTLTYRIVAQVTSQVDLAMESVLNTASVSAPGDGDPSNNSTATSTPLLAAPDYSVRKASNAAGALAPGDTIDYTLLVRNEGNQDGSAVYVTDVFSPTTVEVIGASIDVPAGVTATIDAVGGTITFIIPNEMVEAGDQFMLRYSVSVRETVVAGAESLLNTAIIRGQGDSNGSNDRSDVQLAIDASADVGITITDNVDTVAPGDRPSFDVVIDNAGDQDATGVTATVTYDPAVLDVNIADIVLPPGVTVTQPSPGVLVFEVGTLAADAAALNITIPADVRVALSGITGSLVQATVSAAEDTNPANDAAFDLDTLAAAPDYNVSKQSSNDGALRPGDALTYTITVRNVGNQDGTGVVVTDTLPVGLNRANLVISDGGTFDAGSGSITWNLDSLAVGETRTLTVATSVSTSIGAGVVSLSNAVSVTDDGSNGDDPTPGNNSATDVDPVTANPDLRIDVNDGVDIAQRGDTVTYTLDFSNTGNQGATGTTVVFRFPPGSLDIQSTSIPGVIDVAAGTITFNVGGLDAGAAQRITIVAKVADTAVPDADGRIAVRATIADDGANGADPTPANNVDNESLQFIDDQRNVVFFTDNGRELHDLRHREDSIPDGDRLRVWHYEEQPQWLHGRLISLETMQPEANLVGGRTEVKFDQQFGYWNHQFFPNPWNHERADFVKNAEWLDDFVHWLGAQASELGDDMAGASLEKQIDAAVRGDRGTLLRHLSKLAGAD